jgi:hypothetical protein
MVMRSSSFKRRRLSSALRSTVARLVAGPRSALGVRAMATIVVCDVVAIGMRDCACDNAGAQPEW